MEGKKLLLLLVLLVFFIEVKAQATKYERPKFVYIHTSIIGSKLITRVDEGGSASSFSNKWQIQPSGMIALGIHQNLKRNSKWDYFIEGGGLLFRTRYVFRQRVDVFGIHVSCDFKRNYQNLKVGGGIWGTFIPLSQVKKFEVVFNDISEIQKVWFGISLDTDYKVGKRIDLCLSFSIGAKIHSEPFRGVGGSVYGYENYLPSWTSFGIKYYP